MTPRNNSNSAICRDVRALLSDYIDNTLSARQVWEVEKHLADCSACGEEVKQLRATVQVLHAVPRLDTSDHFMASLHARLDEIDPALVSGRSPWDRLRDWFRGGSMQRSSVPVLSLGLAAAALVVFFGVQRPQREISTAVPAIAVSDGVHLSVSASASNPFSDPAADNLQYRAGAQDGGKPSAAL